MNSGLLDLQALEIAQNRQRNSSKSLQKKGPEKETLGKKSVEAWQLLCD